jgi:hypothetical protein
VRTWPAASPPGNSLAHIAGAVTHFKNLLVQLLELLIVLTRTPAPITLFLLLAKVLVLLSDSPGYL